MGLNSGISRVLAIHLFSYQSGHGERSGGLSTAYFMFLRRASFWTCPTKHSYTILFNLLGRRGSADGDEMRLNLDGETWWCFELPWWSFGSPWWDSLLAYPASRHPSIRQAAFGRLCTKRPPPS